MPARVQMAWLETEDRGDIWCMPRVWEAHLIQSNAVRNLSTGAASGEIKCYAWDMIGVLMLQMGDVMDSDSIPTPLHSGKENVRKRSRVAAAIISVWLLLQSQALQRSNEANSWQRWRTMPYTVQLAEGKWETRYMVGRGKHRGTHCRRQMAPPLRRAREAPSQSCGRRSRLACIAVTFRIMARDESFRVKYTHGCHISGCRQPPLLHSEIN